ncbi:MAG: hypothetical protein ACE5H2_00405 [Terriglobia bacterium]
MASARKTATLLIKLASGVFKSEREKVFQDFKRNPRLAHFAWTFALTVEEHQQRNPSVKRALAAARKKPMPQAAVAALAVLQAFALITVLGPQNLKAADTDFLASKHRSFRERNAYWEEHGSEIAGPNSANPETFEDFADLYEGYDFIKHHQVPSEYLRSNLRRLRWKRKKLELERASREVHLLEDYEKDEAGEPVPGRVVAADEVLVDTKIPEGYAATPDAEGLLEGIEGLPTAEQQRVARASVRAAMRGEDTPGISRKIARRAKVSPSNISKLNQKILQYLDGRKKQCYWLEPALEVFNPTQKITLASKAWITDTLEYELVILLGERTLGRAAYLPEPEWISSFLKSQRTKLRKG